MRKQGDRMDLLRVYPRLQHLIGLAGWRQRELAGGNRTDSHGRTAWDGGDVGGQLLTLLRAQGLVGLPLGPSFFIRQLTDFGEMQTRLSALLGGEMCPLHHSFLQFVLFQRRELAEVVGQSQPFALLALTEAGPGSRQGHERLLLVLA